MLDTAWLTDMTDLDVTDLDIPDLDVTDLDVTWLILSTPSMLDTTLGLSEVCLPARSRRAGMESVAIALMVSRIKSV
jgi:hypothetical protein